MPVAQQIDVAVDTTDHRFVGKGVAQVVAFHRHIGRRGVGCSKLAETDAISRTGDKVVFDQDVVEGRRITIVRRRIIPRLNSNSCRVLRVCSSAGGAGVGDVAIFNGNVRIIVVFQVDVNTVVKAVRSIRTIVVHRQVFQQGVAQLFKIQTFLEVVADGAVFDRDIVECHRSTGLEYRHALRVSCNGTVIYQHTVHRIGRTRSNAYRTGQRRGTLNIGLRNIHTAIGSVNSNTIHAIIYQSHVIDGRIDYSTQHHGILIIRDIHILYRHVCSGNRETCSGAGSRRCQHRVRSRVAAIPCAGNGQFFVDYYIFVESARANRDYIPIIRITIINGCLD
ncbi:MAG: hypothetical protein EPGJADBJ_02704 [Saprospiraceae bacterium]|nr:hypothetical protein [Saprospiraceae bacterium]